MRRSTWTSIFVVPIILGSLVCPAAASADEETTPQAEVSAPATDVDFVSGVYERLRANFYNSKALDPATLLNASLAGLSRYLKTGGFIFSPEKIEAGVPEGAALETFKSEFQRAEVLVAAVKLEPHILAFVASTWLLREVGDSHTKFFTPFMWETLKRSYSGEALGAGIGISIGTAQDGLFYLNEVYPDSPADKAGLKRFDRILAVNSIPAPVEPEYMLKLLQGEKCSEFSLRVERGGKLLDFERLERDDIVFPVAREKTIKSGDRRFGYLKLYSFHTGETFKRTLTHVIKESCRDDVAGYIIDLRDNPGGRMDALPNILGIFLPEKRECFSIENDKEKGIFVTRGKPTTELPLVVIVDEDSGSVSEMFAAVMMEQGRAVVVGARTAGAVNEGTYMNLPYDSGMDVTTGQFQTAGGKILEKIGVMPDIRVQMSAKSITEGRDPQLETAIQVLESQTRK